MLNERQQSLGAELRQAAKDSPNRTFLRMQGVEMTFWEVDDLSDNVASGLAAMGVKQGDNVSLMLPNCPEFLVVWFALSKLGAVAAPVNISFRGQVLLSAIDLVESRLLIAHDSLAEQWQEQMPMFNTIRQVVLVGSATDQFYRGMMTYSSLSVMGEVSPVASVAQPISASSLCLLLYTSGTTGRSKAAMIPHRFVLAQADGVIEGLGLRTDDVLYCPYPLFHLDAAVMTVAPALRLRCIAAIGERFSASRYWDEMRQFKATVFDFMGATLTMLWKQPPSPRDRDHHARLGWGVPMPAWAPEFEERFGCRLVELYGSTEVGTIIYTPQDEPQRKGSCGRLAPQWEAQIQDEEGFPVPAGVVGQLVVRPREPDVIMRGYYGMPNETIAAFRNQWFHTGDLLRQDADGYFYFVGRSKDIVRRRGENISSAEVEMGLETHPDVLEAAVFGVPSEMTEEDVMACVSLREGAKASAEDLTNHCAQVMARFMVPRYIRILSVMPKTPTDKVEKFKLSQLGITADTWDRERKK